LLQEPKTIANVSSGKRNTKAKVSWEPVAIWPAIFKC